MAVKQIEEIRKKVHETSIHISTNLREEEKTRFKTLATNQFNGDYAVTIRWLLDLSEGYFTKPDDVLSARIDVLADEIMNIKTVLNSQKENKPEKSKIKMLSGKTIEK